MAKQHHVGKPSHDVSVAPRAKSLQTRPFQPANEAPAQQDTQAHEKFESASKGFDLISRQTFSVGEPPDPGIGMPLQAQLTIGAPGDKYEQEADRVAEHVVTHIHSPLISATQSSGDSAVQREVPEEEEVQMKPLLQRKQATGEATQAPTELESEINQSRGGGKALDVGLQRSMGQAMGADFSGVKVHTDAQSDKMN